MANTKPLVEPYDSDKFMFCTVFFLNANHIEQYKIFLKRYLSFLMNKMESTFKSKFSHLTHFAI